jgi:MFS family permease
MLLQVKFASVCFAMKKIEVYGRKYSILIGLKLVAFSLLVLSLAYSVHGEGKLILIEKIAATLALFGVFAGFSFSLSPIIALLVSDLFPSKIRGRALGTSALFSYLSGVLVSFTFLSAQEMFGLSAPFALYFIWTFMSIIFVLIAIPETAGKSPHEIHLELEQMWRMITWSKLGK